MDWVTRVEHQGYSVLESVVDVEQVHGVLSAKEAASIPRNRAGIRHMMRDPAVSRIANQQKMLEIARKVLGPGAVPFRATIFDKSPTSNWLVAWHQDTALPLQQRREAEGWGPWSVKEGVNYAHAPARALEKVIALRLHLDDSGADNGPLRVLPGTHRQGVSSRTKKYTRYREKSRPLNAAQGWAVWC